MQMSSFSPSDNRPSLEPSIIRQKIMGCWLGKAVGGTLGMPFEGQDGPFDLEFYTPVPTGMLPNDDLDLQVVWACFLDRMDSPRVDRHLLAQAWLDHVDFPWDEYGVVLRNLSNGLKPPLSGSYDNWFVNGMGAPIRSEIWACLAPGNPELAAAYAYEDACVDHDADGIWGEIFLASLQSAAFIESEPKKLLAAALAQLPEHCRTRKAVTDTEQWWQERGDWRSVRNSILDQYGHDNFTDAPMNIAFTVLGWLAGAGDFSKAICIAVNCGKDTDCTGATTGALMGLLDPEGIPEHWLSPIGRDLVISPQIAGIKAPKSLEHFTDLILSLQSRLEGAIPDVVTPPQSTESLRISVQCAFRPRMPERSAIRSVQFTQSRRLPGTLASLPRDEFADEFLLLRYNVRLEQTQRVRILFNTREMCRVWLNGNYLFERTGGVMTPAFHRPPSNQSAELELPAGEHVLIAALRRPPIDREAEWVIGVGDAATNHWLPRALLA